VRLNKLNNMKLKFKKLHPEAVIPSYQKEGDAGLDLTAVDFEIDKNGNASYNTYLSMEIPEGYVGLIFPRSSICKTDLALSNAVGVIDSNYRGPVTFKFKPTAAFKKAEGNYETVAYKKGDRVGQLIVMPVPHIETIEVKELSETIRGAEGFGSSGN
jgi:dUTP pyrophosphatase